MNEIDIKGKNKPAILAALYNASRPLGLGILHYTSQNMLESEAAEVLAECSYVDYLKGRVIKVDFSTGYFTPCFI